MISWCGVCMYCTAWPWTDRKLYQQWSCWWPELKGGERVLRYFNNLGPDCYLQQDRRYYDRNWKGSLTGVSETVLQPHKLTLLIVRTDWKNTMIFVLSYPLWLSTSQINLIAAGTEGRREGSYIFQQSLPYLMSPAANYYLYWET